MDKKTFLQRLRNKPEKVRQRILMGTMLVLLPVLIAVWIVSARLSQSENSHGMTASGFGKFLKDTGNSISEKASEYFSSDRTDTFSPPTTEENQ